MKSKIAVGLAGAAVLMWTTGCRVNVQKDSNGQEKKVQVETPFGGVHVDTDQTTASDLGLTVYPGAKLWQGDDEHKSADIDMGFGELRLRVKAVSYSSPDAQDKVVTYYKQALGRFGPVLTCKNNNPVGTPIATPQGLTCADDHKHTNVDVGGGVQLKAGSTRHQHIVGFETPVNGQTRFTLISIDLPTGAESSGTSD